MRRVFFYFLFFGSFAARSGTSVAFTVENRCGHDIDVATLEGAGIDWQEEQKIAWGWRHVPAHGSSSEFPTTYIGHDYQSRSVLIQNNGHILTHGGSAGCIDPLHAFNIIPASQPCNGHTFTTAFQHIDSPNGTFVFDQCDTTDSSATPPAPTTAHLINHSTYTIYLQTWCDGMATPQNHTMAPNSNQTHNCPAGFFHVSYQRSWLPGCVNEAKQWNLPTGTYQFSNTTCGMDLYTTPP